MNNSSTHFKPTRFAAFGAFCTLSGLSRLTILLILGLSLAACGGGSSGGSSGGGGGGAKSGAITVTAFPDEAITENHSGPLTGQLVFIDKDLVNITVGKDISGNYTFALNSAPSFVSVASIIKGDNMSNGEGLINLTINGTEVDDAQVGNHTISWIFTGLVGVSRGAFRQTGEFTLTISEVADPTIVAADALRFSQPTNTADLGLDTRADLAQVFPISFTFTDDDYLQPGNSRAFINPTYTGISFDITQPGSSDSSSDISCPISTSANNANNISIGSLVDFSDNSITLNGTLGGGAGGEAANGLSLSSILSAPGCDSLPIGSRITGAEISGVAMATTDSAAAIISSNLIASGDFPAYVLQGFRTEQPLLSVADNLAIEVGGTGTIALTITDTDSDDGYPGNPTNNNNANVLRTATDSQWDLGELSITQSCAGITITDPTEFTNSNNNLATASATVTASIGISASDSATGQCELRITSDGEDGIAPDALIVNINIVELIPFTAFPDETITENHSGLLTGQLSFTDEDLIGTAVNQDISSNYRVVFNQIDSFISLASITKGGEMTDGVGVVKFMIDASKVDDAQVGENRISWTFIGEESANRRAFQLTGEFTLTISGVADPTMVAADALRFTQPDDINDLGLDTRADSAQVFPISFTFADDDYLQPGNSREFVNPTYTGVSFNITQPSSSSGNEISCMISAAASDISIGSSSSFSGNSITLAGTLGGVAANGLSLSSILAAPGCTNLPIGSRITGAEISGVAMGTTDSETTIISSNNLVATGDFPAYVIQGFRTELPTLAVAGGITIESGTSGSINLTITDTDPDDGYPGNPTNDNDANVVRSGAGSQWDIGEFLITGSCAGVTIIPPTEFVNPNNNLATGSATATAIIGISTTNLAAGLCELRIFSSGEDDRDPLSIAVSISIEADTDGDGVLDSTDVDADGDGLIDISSADELNMIRNNRTGESLDGVATGCGNGVGINECSGYELVADIDLISYPNWTPIGNCGELGETSSCGQTNTNRFFSSYFNGNGYSISNLTIVVDSSIPVTLRNGVGLFGAITHTSEIHNLTLNNVNVNAALSDDVGGLVGYCDSSGDGVLITSVKVNAMQIAGNDRVGGLAGGCVSSTITSSSAQVLEINANNFIGGLVGEGRNAILTSVNTSIGQINANTQVGGLAGSCSNSRISFATTEVGQINANDEVGGLGGVCSSATIISSSAKVRQITANDFVGGLVGRFEFGFGSARARVTSSSAQVEQIVGRNGLGGLIGSIAFADVISSSASVAKLSGADDVGGLIGSSGVLTITSSSASIGDLTGSTDVGGLVGDGPGITITSSYAVTATINSSNSGDPITTGSLVGLTNANTAATASYWDSRVIFANVSANNIVGVGQTTDQLRGPTTFTGTTGGTGAIYATWATAYCNPATGEYMDITSGEVPDGFQPAWDLGTGSEYPVLTCLRLDPDAILTPAQVRDSANRAIAGNSPLPIIPSP